MDQVIKGSEKSKESVDQDVNLRLYLENSNNVSPLEDMEEVIDVSQVFEDERNASNCYRFLGTTNIIASNVLFNWSGECSYADIESLRDFDTVTDTYTFEDEEVLFEDDGWFYFVTGGTCERKFLEPVPDRFPLLRRDGDQNWDLFITYPAEKDAAPLFFNGIPLSDGLAVYSGFTVTVDDRQMVALISSVNHGLSQNDDINIKSSIPTEIEGRTSVYQVGLPDGTMRNNVFIIDKLPILLPDFLSFQVSFKRIVEGVPSEYYSRWFKKLTNTAEYETYPTAFAQNIYNDQNFSYNFNTDVDISGVVDHRGRPLTEAYLTTIKKNEVINNAGTGTTFFWTEVESGIDSAIFNSNYDINSITSVSVNDSIESTITSTKNLYFGDIVEFNALEYKEKVLQIAHHRFNTKNRADNNFLEGYYYQPHNKIQLRLFEDFVSQDFRGNEDVPDWAEFLNDGRAFWRNILENSFTNEQNIPFLNGCHYIFSCWNIFIKRQDPCNDYDLGTDSYIFCDLEDTSRFEEEVILDDCE